MTGGVSYEVNAFVQLRDPNGHRHFLGPDKELPDWVSDEEARRLVDAGIVTKYEEI